MPSKHMKQQHASMQDPQENKLEAILASGDGLANMAPDPALEARILRRLAVEMAARPEVASVGLRLRMAAAVLLLLVNTATLLYFLQPDRQQPPSSQSPHHSQPSADDYWSYTQDNRLS
jgi:hypothetical protein